MPLKDACGYIDQAMGLGLKSVVYLGGGEPLLYRHFWPFIEHLKKKEVVPVIFTNGTLIDKNVARRLFNLGASIIIKLDSLDKKVQEKLTGVNTYKKIKDGIDTFIKTGFAELNDGYTRLGVGACANKINLHEIPEVWKFARKNNIFPNIEFATPIGNATSDIALSPKEVAWLWKKLRKIDEKEFGIKWPIPYSSIPGHSCGIFLAGAAIKADGSVALCPEMPSIGSLKEKSLAEIIRKPIFSKARKIEKNIEEPCVSCEFISLCLGGCRSKALVYNKSIYANDPYCPLNNDKK